MEILLQGSGARTKGGKWRKQGTVVLDSLLAATIIPLLFVLIQLLFFVQEGDGGADVFLLVLV